MNIGPPSYLELHHDGRLKERAAQVVELMRECRLCPRDCGVNRLADEHGFCRTGRKARAASCNAHFGEERPLVGRFGSGTIFFSSCNLLCSFCQNYETSHLNVGVEVESEQLADMMLSLAGQRCHNINFVTPTHVIPQILEALVVAVEQGFDLPLVYNSGGYDNVATLKLLNNIFDIYMPDFKFWAPGWATQYCNAPDYRERAVEAIREMHRQVGDLEIDDLGIAKKGLLVRHLVMPEGVAGTREIMTFLADEISRNTYVNVMAQYRPCGQAYNDDTVNRLTMGGEFRAAVDAAHEAGLERLDR